MSNKKNHLDEMQEQKLLRIEKDGVWLAFWGLLAAILVQTFISLGQENVFRDIAGEWIVFMCLAVYLGVSCIKNGIWDRHLQPNIKTNLLISFLSSAAFGILFFVATYFRYEKLYGSIATGIIIFVMTFLLTLAALSVSAALYKKRVAKLEAESESESD